MGKLDRAVRHLREKASKGNFIPFYKFPIGKSDLRIVPAAKGDDKDDWFLLVGQHYGVEEKAPVYCPFEHEENQDPCPICEMVAEFRKEGLNDEASRMSVRRRAVVRAIVRGEEEKGVQLVNLPSTVFLDICELLNDSDTWGDVLSPSPKGRDIRVLKTGQGLNTKYSVQVLPKTGPLLPSQADTKELLDELSPITAIVKVPSFEDLARLVKDKMGYTSFGDSIPPRDTDWEEENEAEDEVEADGDWDETTEDDNSPVVAEDAAQDEWLEDEDDEADDDIPDISEIAKKDQEALRLNLESDLGKKHKVTRKKG